MFQTINTPIPGLLSVDPLVRDDARGNFAKLLHHDYFETHAMSCNCAESYISSSKKNVLRGMHFQNPPHDHEKVVYCIGGAVLDVVLDLRKDSPTFGKSFSRQLDGLSNQGMYIPKGCAHGFLTLSENALMLYYVSTTYSPEHDSGIHWNSFGYDWPVGNPLISDRDETFIGLSDFVSPFY